eukprot:TRINITY_DN21985_c0_g1_i1.p1 TRINITY_DN21985_c0_g1~~TRINITY_DN21985_c0_g1_i1.p1  ORF type:complete len:388 (+),score=95.38 TRINITY_DN21985_c0_g1_i1:102-1265(+)
MAPPPPPPKGKGRGKGQAAAAPQVSASASPPSGAAASADPKAMAPAKAGDGCDGSPEWTSTPSAEVAPEQEPPPAASKTIDNFKEELARKLSLRSAPLAAAVQPPAQPDVVDAEEKPSAAPAVAAEAPTSGAVPSKQLTPRLVATAAAIAAGATAATASVQGQQDGTRSPAATPMKASTPPATTPAVLESSSGALARTPVLATPRQTPPKTPPKTPEEGQPVEPLVAPDSSRGASSATRRPSEPSSSVSRLEAFSRRYGGTGIPGAAAQADRPGIQLEESALAAGMYTTWGRKNLEGELQQSRGELREARLHASQMEEELRRLQQENAKLRHQLDIQRDRDTILRDIRESLEGSNASQRLLDHSHSSPSERQGRSLCGSVCALFGRR